MPAPRRRRKPIPPALNSQRTGNQLGRKINQEIIEMLANEYHGLAGEKPQTLISLDPNKVFALERRAIKRKHNVEDRKK